MNSGWVLILLFSWNNPAIAVIDNIPTQQDCKRMGDELTKTDVLSKVFTAHYHCIWKYS